VAARSGSGTLALILIRVRAVHIVLVLFLASLGLLVLVEHELVPTLVIEVRLVALSARVGTVDVILVLLQPVLSLLGSLA
jgi:hypothetical protein